MYKEPELKPLFANLKRLKIGAYLNSNDFELFSIEKDFDDTWNQCKDDINNNKTAFIIGHHNTEDDEEAFLLLMSEIYNEDSSLFVNFIFDILFGFAKWATTKIDFTHVTENLKDLEIVREDILFFVKEIRKIQKSKPLKIKKETIVNQPKNTQKQSKVDSNKIFVVHGWDDKSRLELCNILKEDFKLQPVVLQEKPNNTIETIIAKFERLASECAAAIVMFTPDDKVGDHQRARQNVILELGYFLGKFQNPEERKIIILKKGEIEIPSDISGVLYLEYNKHIKEVYYDLKKQFDHWGY
jgi:predicted nucleotide-binding protein